MSEQTENHEYATPAAGSKDWHEPLNANFERLDLDVEVRDVAENREDYEPEQGAKFLELDSGIVYIGDGDAWVPTLALAYFDENGELDCGEVADCLTSEEESQHAVSNFGENARSVHDGAIVFGDSTQRSIWSESSDEIRSQMPIYAPTFATRGAYVGDSIVESELLSAEALHSSSIEAGGLSANSEHLTFESAGQDDPVLHIGDGIHSTWPIYAPEFVEINSSARAGKTAIEPVHPERVLKSVESLPVCTWEYRNNGGCRHMGPMAEEFAETFDLGNRTESIATVDADGVALAAIQGLAERLTDHTDQLHEQLAEKTDQIDSLKAENESLRTRLAEIEDRIGLSSTATDTVTSSDD